MRTRTATTQSRAPSTALTRPGGVRGALAVGVAVTMLVLAGTTAPAQARSDGPASGSSVDLRVIGSNDLGAGLNAQVTAHRGHAYVGSWATQRPASGGEVDPATCPSVGIRVVDLSDPSAPEVVSTFADGVEGEGELLGTWTEKAAVERFGGRDIAAVGAHNCTTNAFRGFGLWDVSNPADPQRLALVPTDPRTGGVQELWLQRRGHELFLYITVPLSELRTGDPAAGVPGTPDFQIWNVTRPSEPVKVGEWGAWAELGIPPTSVDENGVPRTSLTRSVTGPVLGRPDLVYVPYWDSGTMILDVSDPSDPTFVGRTQFEPEETGNAHSVWLARGGTILIETNEPGNPRENPALEFAWGHPRIYDISDPANPVRLSEFELPSTRQDPPEPGFLGVHDPKVRGSTMFLSWFGEGVVVADITRPGQPKLLDQFKPSGTDPTGIFCGSVGAECAATWGVELHRNLILASDTLSGLWVLKQR